MWFLCSHRPSSPRVADALGAAGFRVGEMDGFAGTLESSVDDEDGEMWQGGSAEGVPARAPPRKSGIEKIGSRLQMHLQQAALQSAALASAAETKQKVSTPAVAGQIWEDRANAARGMAKRMSERLWNLSGSKPPQGIEPASLEEALSHCDAALTAAEYAAKVRGGEDSTSLAAFGGRLKHLDEALRAAAIGDVKLARALPERKQLDGASGTRDPAWAAIVACETAAGLVARKLSDALAGIARANEAQHDNHLSLRKVKELEQSVRAANAESVAILKLNAELEGLILSTLAQKPIGESPAAPSTIVRSRLTETRFSGRGILLPSDAGTQRTSKRVSFNEDLNQESQPRSTVADSKAQVRSSINDLNASLAGQRSSVNDLSSLDGRPDEVSDGSFVGTPLKAARSESADFPSSWVEASSSDDEGMDQEAPRFSEPLTAFEKAREAAWNEDPPLPSPRKRSSGFDRLGLSPRAVQPPPRITSAATDGSPRNGDRSSPQSRDAADMMQFLNPSRGLSAKTPPPPALTGHLWKKSPSSLRLWAYQKRYIEVRGMLLIWWKSHADALSSGSFTARDGAQQHAGLIDLRQTPCDIQALGTQEQQPTFSLQPRSGAHWQGSNFTGGDATRVFVFDTSDSEHNRDKWVQVIKAHMAHADGLAQNVSQRRLSS